MSQNQDKTQDQSVDDIDLQYTQNKRRALIDIMSGDIKALSEDGEKLGNVIRLMDGMDKQIISKKRLETDNNTAALQQQAFALAMTLSRQSSGKNPFLLSEESPGKPPQSFLPGFVVDDGELSTKLDTERSDDFLARMRAKEEEENK